MPKCACGQCAIIRHCHLLSTGWAFSLLRAQRVLCRDVLSSLLPRLQAHVRHGPCCRPVFLNPCQRGWLGSPARAFAWCACLGHVSYDSSLTSALCVFAAGCYFLWYVQSRHKERHAVRAATQHRTDWPRELAHPTSGLGHQGLSPA